MYISRKSISLVVVSVAVLIAPIASMFKTEPKPPSPPAGIHQGAPPYYLGLASRRSLSLKIGDLTTIVSFSPKTQSLNVKWVNYVGTLSTREKYQCDYWPTSITFLEDNVLLVAGKARNGDTVLERVRLELPHYVATSEGPKITPGGITSIDLVYSDAIVGQDMILTLAYTSQRPDSVLALFYDSVTIADISLLDGSISVIAGNDSGEGAFQLPYLSVDYNRATASVHSSYGLVYAFFADEIGGLFMTMFDGDADGTVDSAMQLDLDTWHSLGLDRALDYLD